MSPLGLKFSQIILHTETSKLMYNWSFLFLVLHKPTLLPSTFNDGPEMKVIEAKDYMLTRLDCWPECGHFVHVHTPIEECSHFL